MKFWKDLLGSKSPSQINLSKILNTDSPDSLAKQIYYNPANHITIEENKKKADLASVAQFENLWLTLFFEAGAIVIYYSLVLGLIILLCVILYFLYKRKK